MKNKIFIILLTLVMAAMLLVPAALADGSTYSIFDVEIPFVNMVDCYRTTYTSVGTMQQVNYFAYPYSGIHGRQINSLVPDVKTNPDNYYYKFSENGSDIILTMYKYDDPSYSYVLSDDGFVQTYGDNCFIYAADNGYYGTFVSFRDKAYHLCSSHSTHSVNFSHENESQLDYSRKACILCGCGETFIIRGNNPSIETLKNLPVGSGGLIVPVEFTVTITPGSGMSKTTDSGAAEQVVEEKTPITEVVYKADTGYHFPEDYAVETVNGITVTRVDDTQITVSGTPTANTAITLSAASNTYTITFDTAGGTAIDPITQEYGTDVTTPADPTKTGYNFAGWDKAIPTTMPAENVTITAKWTVNQYTITFETAGGSAVAPITQDYNTAVTAPADPTKTGYNFAGWDKTIPTTMPAENVTITAKWTTNQYTITFETAGGSTVAPITQDYNTAVTAPAAPTKTGYNFAGWDKMIPTTMPAENMTITAQWTTNQYTITFETAGGSTVAPITQDYNTAVTAPAAPTKTGYTFAGWDAEIPTTMPAENVTITAKWTVNQYTITFDTDGGTEVASITQDYGTDVAAPADPTKEGYTFAGWDAEIPTAMPAENVTITAKWTTNQYTITFDADGGSTVAPITQDYGTAVTAPADPTKTGYNFAGWDKTIPTTMPAENVTITAKWETNQYTITFDTAGGTAIDPVTQEYDTAVNAPADPTKEGYTFVGWDKPIPTTMPAENVTITAKWTTNQYTITFETAGGSAIAPITQDYNMAVTAPADPTKEGYTFAGWDAEIPTTMPAENVTITAKWETNQYTITFDTDGGSTVAPITQDYNTAVTAPADPTKEGYTFAGWDKTIPATMPTENVTITAKWTTNQYTITFETAGGSAVAPITQDYNTAVTAPADPTKEGYTFAGWDAEIPTTMPAENVTITAKWETNQYTITFDTDGGTEVASITQDYGTDVAAPAAPTKTGYNFAGWDAEIPTAMPAENVTITAQWTVNQYTITFETTGGSAIAPITQDYNTAVTAPADPTKEGYTFAGWDAGIPTTMPAENVTITAKWTTNQYTITFETAGGSAIAPITQDYNTAVTAPAAPTKTGYNFAGWDKTIPTTMPAENMTITAKWSILPVIISPTSEQTVTVNEGEQASMSIKAQNAVAYQWYVNYNDGTGWHKCGKDSTTYTSSITTLSNNGYRYKCVATGESGDTVESVLFTLKVLKNVDVPQTSDPTQIGLWMILCIISCAGLFALTFNAKKQKVE